MLAKHFSVLRSRLPGGAGKRGYIRNIVQIVINLIFVLWLFSCQLSNAQTSSSANSISNSSITNAIKLPQEGSGHVTNNPTVIPDANSAAAAIGLSYLNDISTQRHFEVYLDLPETSKIEVGEYLQKITLVVSYLKDNDPSSARKVLNDLSQYQDLDAGLSGELGNRIDAVWKIQHANEKIEEINQQLQSSVQASERSPEEIADEIRKQKYHQHKEEPSGANDAQIASVTSPIVDPSTLERGGVNVLPPPSDIPQTIQLTQEYVHTIETKDKINSNNVDETKLLDQSRSDFIQYVSQLYDAHHFYQVVMAAGFYRALFKEENYQESMATQVASSLEINDKVSQAIGAVQDNSNKGDIVAAMNQLQKAFALSAFDPEVLGVPLAQKKPIGTFRRQLAKLQNMITARDFTDLEAILNDIQKTVPDFDIGKTLEMVNAVKAQSQLMLDKAKLAIQQGNLKQALENIQEAAEAWPDNPRLKDRTLHLFNSEDVQNQASIDFDRLMNEANYRVISDKQTVFALAMADDPKRQKQLAMAIEKVKIADAALEKSRFMQSKGDNSGAWETIQLALEECSGDAELNTSANALTQNSTEFISAIKKARDAENRQELGYSLTWYAVAQHYYPNSQIANQAIERLSKNLLRKN
jgi:hypothetical protein